MTPSPSGAEQPLVFRKSSFSGSSVCVEVAPLPDGGVALRDSKNPTVPHFSFTAAEWTAFLQGAKAREFELDVLHGS